MKWRNKIIKANHPYELIPVTIVNYSAIGNQDVCSGRMVPLLIVDTSNRLDIKACLEAHQESQIAGEVKTNWGRRDSPHSGPITLTIRFKKPALCTIIFHLDIEEYGGLIDQIVEAEGLWLTWGNTGDRFVNTISRIKVFIEIESKEFYEAWDYILDKYLRDSVRKKGATKEAAALYSRKVRKEWREIGKGFVA